jgi:hypothetical protein
MDRSLLNSIVIVLFGAMLSFIAARYWFQRNQAVADAKRLADEVAAAKKVADEDRRRTDARVAELELQLSAVKQTVLPISAAFQAILIKELTHYHTPRMDELMKKLGPPVTLNEAEQAELAALLHARTVDMDGRISDSERDAATMLPLVVKRVVAEGLADDPVRLGVVTTPVTSEEKSK